MKRSITNKKKAYEQVFGDDAGAVQFFANPRSSPSVYHSINYEPQSKQLPRNRKKKTTEDSTKFKKIISKLDSMNMVFEGKADRSELDRQVEQKFAASQEQARILKTQQDEMLQKVRNFVQRDKNNKFKNTYAKIRRIEDLKMVDPDFLLELKRHKQKRLLKMKCDLMMFDSVRTEVGFDSKSNTYYESSQEYLNTDINRIREAPSIKDASIYIERPNTEQLRQIEISQHKMTRAEKILDFLRFFFRTKQQGQRFGIPFAVLYEGMYMHPQPYELQGSYLFFQAIKHKDIQTVKSIVKVQDLSVFQIDDVGRTPLIYACQLNLLEVVQLLINKGVNLNATCFQGKTSLYYAIANNNPQIVFQLLYKGCSPWSQPNCNLSQVINRTNNEAIKSLIQISRRIAIILKITPYKLRPRCWQQEKQSIRRVFNKSRQE